MLVSVFGATGKTGALVQQECLRSRDGLCERSLETPRRSPPRPASRNRRGRRSIPGDVARGIAGARCNPLLSRDEQHCGSRNGFLRKREAHCQSDGTRASVVRLLAIAWVGVLAHPYGWVSKQGRPAAIPCSRLGGTCSQLRNAARLRLGLDADVPGLSQGRIFPWDADASNSRACHRAATRTGTQIWHTRWWS